MALKEYKPGTTFTGSVGRTVGESEPAWPAPLRAKEGAPNLLFIVLDDDRWPLGRGFERYYGFLGGDTHQYYPDLVYDNHQVDPPKTPEEGYHLTEDLTDKAMQFIADSKQLAPNKPFFLYFCTVAMHAPHHVPKEWADNYKGKFDVGWDKYREKVFNNAPDDLKMMARQ